MAQQKKIKELEIKKHDLQPHYVFQIKTASGVGINLTGATIRATMKRIQGGSIQINRQTAGISFADTANGDDIITGKGHYEWQATETDISGRYLFELEVTPVSGGKFTFPNGKIKSIVTIYDDLDNT